MPHKRERHLVILMVAVSLVLTGLTVWAVAVQGQALRARELSDLRSAATSAATQRQAALRTDLERTFDAAARAWEAGGPDELDAWAARRPTWLLACLAGRDEAWTVCPRTPLEAPLPTTAPGVESSPGTRDLLTMLRDFQRLATSPDPLTRAAALIAMATVEQQLGHPLAAARIFADAAQLLRSTPNLARFAFRAESARIDSLLAAGDHERARDALLTFLSGLRTDHPARLGPAELSRLQNQAAALIPPADTPLAAALADLQTRVQRRALVVDAVQHCLSTGAPMPTSTSDGIQFRTATTAGGEPLVLALRSIAEDAVVALVTPAADILALYWKPAADSHWQVRLPGAGSAPALAQLGPEFGGAILEPAPETTATLAAAARRQLGIVLATAAGTAGAWALVIWMMSRVVARQRELARLQSRFVADVSHELKTPLALIRLLSETLAGRRVRDPEKIQSYHETITRESERLTMLLENILDMGRIESGGKQYEFGDCDVAAVTQQAWALFEPQFASEGFDARFEILGQVPRIRADAAALQQVIVNLLQNAHRYSGEGKFVRLTLAREGFVVVISVEDHGLGMSRAQLNRLGESFFRAEDARVRQTRGVGLGLAIAHHIVTAHRGRIEVQSRPGQGSKFSVWIPFEPEA